MIAALVGLTLLLAGFEKVVLDVLDPLVTVDRSSNFALGLLVGSAWGVPAAVAVSAERRAVKVPAAALAGCLALVALSLFPPRRGPAAWEADAQYLAPGVLAGAFAGALLIGTAERLRHERTSPPPPSPEPAEGSDA